MYLALFPPIVPPIVTANSPTSGRGESPPTDVSAVAERGPTNASVTVEQPSFDPPSSLHTPNSGNFGARTTSSPFASPPSLASSPNGSPATQPRFQAEQMNTARASFETPAGPPSRSWSGNDSRALSTVATQEGPAGRPFGVPAAQLGGQNFPTSTPNVAVNAASRGGLTSARPAVDGVAGNAVPGVRYPQSQTESYFESARDQVATGLRVADRRLTSPVAGQFVQPQGRQAEQPLGRQPGQSNAPQFGQPLAPQPGQSNNHLGPVDISNGVQR